MLRERIEVIMGAGQPLFDNSGKPATRSEYECEGYLWERATRARPATKSHC